VSTLAWDSGEPPRVSVIVVSYEAREELCRCLAALATHVTLPHEVIVVDNASADGSAPAVRSLFPAVRLLEVGDNVGFARGCNLGLEAARGDYVLLLNPDAELEAGALEALYAFLEDHPGVAAVGPRVVHADGTPQLSFGRDLTLVSEWRQRRLVRGLARRDAHIVAEITARIARPQQPDWVSGACLLARTADLRAIDGFDAGFFLYEEDADLCRRLRAAGGTIAFTPAATVIHHLGRSMARNATRARLAYHASHLRYYDKHNGPFARAALRLLLLGRAAGQVLDAARRRDAAGGADGRALARLALGR
jgi:GT2 family glycosyltransferase